MNPFTLTLVLGCLTAWSYGHGIDEDEDQNTLSIDPRTGMVSYQNYRVIQAHPTTQEHLDVLRFISKGNNNNNAHVLFNCVAVGHKKSFFFELIFWKYILRFTCQANQKYGIYNHIAIFHNTIFKYKFVLSCLSTPISCNVCLNFTRFI